MLWQDYLRSPTWQLLPVVSLLKPGAKPDHRSSQRKQAPARPAPALQGRLDSRLHISRRIRHIGNPAIPPDDDMRGVAIDL